MSRFLQLVALLLVFGILFSILLLVLGSFTPNEAAMMSILLTVFSILATWIVSHGYSQQMQSGAIKEVKEFHQERLRTYASKAAEKVTNLSNQLNRLSAYLQQGLENDDYEVLEELVLFRSERLASAIHMINTLKSVNDTSLSDWEGIIDDQLDQQREEQVEREEQLLQLIEKFEPIAAFSRGPAIAIDQVRSELESVRQDLTSLVVNMTGAPIRVRRSKKGTKLETKGVCPSCNNPVSYRQRPRKNSIKTLSCDGCGTPLLSSYNLSKGEFQLSPREILVENINCPWCGTANEIRLDNLPGAFIDSNCDVCTGMFCVSRSNIDIRINQKGRRPEHLLKNGAMLPDSLIDSVDKLLPEQPWEKQIHRVIAEELGVPPKDVSRAINCLISRGKRMPQIDGIVYSQKMEADLQKALNANATENEETPPSTSLPKLSSDEDHRSQGDLRGKIDTLDN